MTAEHSSIKNYSSNSNNYSNNNSYTKTLNNSSSKFLPYPLGLGAALFLLQAFRAVDLLREVRLPEQHLLSFLGIIIRGDDAVGSG